MKIGDADAEHILQSDSNPTISKIPAINFADDELFTVGLGYDLARRNSFFTFIPGSKAPKGAIIRSSTAPAPSTSTPPAAKRTTRRRLWIHPARDLKEFFPFVMLSHEHQEVSVNLAGPFKYGGVALKQILSAKSSLALQPWNAAESDSVALSPGLPVAPPTLAPSSSSAVPSSPTTVASKPPLSVEVKLPISNEHSIAASTQAVLVAFPTKPTKPSFAAAVNASNVKVSFCISIRHLYVNARSK